MEGLQTILQMKYARIVNGIAEKLGISLEEALDRMYNSETFKLIDGKIAELHCRSDLYLIDEFINEWKEKGDLPE